jgi:haloacetate dehalogenase
MAALMSRLGHERFAVVGHDRGGRVAHRLALDHAPRVSSLCVLDIAPTLDMYDATDMAFASAYYHWFHLIQPAPLPERMIGGDARFYLHWSLGGWGANGTAHIEAKALAEYERCFCRAEAIHAACEDYRAAAGIDLAHDRASRAAGHQVDCDTLVLWSAKGVVQRLFKPIELWQAQCAGRVSGATLPCGHFLPEELPDDTAAALLAHLRVQPPPAF